MKRTRNLKLALLPFYPLLLAVYPVLYLWTSNRAQQPAYVVIPSLLATLAGALGVFVLFLALLRSAHRAALPAALVSFFVLTFGHFANLIQESNEAIDAASLLPATLLVALGLVALVLLGKIGSPTLTKTLNLVTAALVLMQVVPALPYYLTMAQVKRASAMASPLQNTIPLTSHSRQPRDVYFILIDNYGRQDILLEGSKVDNSEVVDALKARGFVFPDCPQANYMWTAPAVTSILNMSYLDQLGVPESAYIKRGGYEKMAPLIQNSEVMRKFKQYGYHTVTFRGFMGLIDIQTSDTYINFEKDKTYTQRLETAKFQDLYWNTTLLAAADSALKGSSETEPVETSLDPEDLIGSSEVLEPQFYQVYQQNLFAFEALERIPSEVAGPKFVYAHIYSAHWPFIIYPDGSLRLPFTKEQTVPGYVDSVRYTNSRIIAAVDSILKNSKVEPIIILQSDHSNEWTRPVEWSGKDRLKILSAFYLPGGGDALLYDEISPVNNFRLIFSHYFGEDLPLQPDKYFYKDPSTRKMREAGPTCISESQ